MLRGEHYAHRLGQAAAGQPGVAAAFGHGGATGTRLWIDPAHDLVFLYLTGVWEMPARADQCRPDAVYAALP